MTPENGSFPGFCYIKLFIPFGRICIDWYAFLVKNEAISDSGNAQKNFVWFFKWFIFHRIVAYNETMWWKYDKDDCRASGRWFCEVKTFPYGRVVSRGGIWLYLLSFYESGGKSKASSGTADWLRVYFGRRRLFFSRDKKMPVDGFDSIDRQNVAPYIHDTSVLDIRSTVFKQIKDGLKTF